MTEGRTKSTESPTLGENKETANPPLVGKLAFSPLESRPLSKELGKEQTHWDQLQIHIEVQLGTKTLSLKELTSLQVGQLLPLEQLAEEPVSIYANGKKVAKGEIVAVEGFYGVKIVSFEKNPSDVL